MKKFRVGVLGCGDISDIYIARCKESDILEITACASLHIENAILKAEKYNIPKACSIEELISDPQIEIILNLTLPKVHAKLTIASLESGKHVYSEKPLAISLNDALKIQSLAELKKLRVGCAPDTFLGGRLQTCRSAIDNGMIGEPTAFSAFLVNHGHERYHPNPEFFYKPGAGPLLDLGPYYITALVSLLGPVKKCCGFAKTTFAERIIETQPNYGNIINVEVPTHVCGLLEFSNGVIGTLIHSFDVWDSQLPRIEIYGTEGTLCIPDPDPEDGPNLFGGLVYIKNKNNARWNYKPRVEGLENWEVVPNLHSYNENYRGIGLIDMAYSIVENRPHRANSEMAYHVLEVMLGILDSAKEERYYTMKSNCSRPDPLPIKFMFNNSAP